MRLRILGHTTVTWSRVLFAIAAASLGSFALPGCVESTCDDKGSCNPYEPNGGSSGADVRDSSDGKGGSGGKAGTGGGPQGGTTAGDGGSEGGTPTQGGGGATTGGDGGGGGVVSLPCDGACTAPKPVCDEPSDACVECLGATDCTSGTKKKCDTTAKACVECIAPADCSNATAAKCDAGACSKCTSNDDCAHIAGKTVCDTAAGECVQCTGKDYAACGMDAGTPRVCDSLKRTCSTQKEHSAGLCQACVNDQQCKAGQLCIKETFGEPAKDVGYFCFATQAAATSADCTLIDNQPYVATLKNQTSIDGDTADICGLRSSTCVARNQFSSKDCNTSSAAEDQKCGFAPGKDSKSYHLAHRSSVAP